MLTRIIAYGCAILTILFLPLQGIHAQERIEAQRSYVVSAKRQAAICKRVERRFAKKPKQLERIDRRLQKRFGFTCSVEEEIPEEIEEEVQEEPETSVEVKEKVGAVSSSGRRVLQRSSRRARNRVTDGGELLIGVIEPTSSRWDQYQAALKGDLVALYQMGIFASGTSGVGVETAYAFYFLSAEGGNGKAKQTLESVVNKMDHEQVQEGDVLIGKLRDIIRSNGGTVSVDEETMTATRDAQRRSDVNTLLNSFWQYAIDNSGKMPFDIPEGATVEICRISGSSCGDLVDVHDKLAGVYLVSVPADPSLTGSETRTNYFVKHEKNRITVSAPGAETIDVISVMR